MMDDRDIKKLPGQTWIDINGQIHTFKAHDDLHERSDEIYKELRKINEELNEAGHIPDTKLVHHKLSEEHKAVHLCSHRLDIHSFIL
jgi:hypothetical protein